jgi:hypothetical protein
MSTAQLEDQILGILQSSGLEREEIKIILQNLNNKLQNPEEDDFFLRLRNGFEAQTLKSNSRWLSSKEVDSYL